MDPEVGQRKAWVEAFVAAQHDLPVLKRDKTVEVETKTGGHFTYSYADLAAILEAVDEVLARHELAVAQEVVSDAGEGIGVVTRIYHAAGWCEVFGPMYLFRPDDPQQAGSAITYARRYALTAALGIATETDDDAVSAARGSSPSIAVSVEDPHCPACLTYNGELVALTKQETAKGKIYWRCSNRGRDCPGFTMSGDKAYSLSLWVEGDDDPDDWEALSDRWLRSKGIFPLSQDSVGPEVLIHVRDEVMRTVGWVGDPTEELTEAIYGAVAMLLAEGRLDDDVVERGGEYEGTEQKLKAMAMAIPMRLADEWTANAASLIDLEARKEEE